MAEYANAAFEERRRPRTKLWAGLAIGFFAVLAAGLYSAFWFDTAARLKDGIIEWTAAQRAAGNFVVFNNLQITGFPLAFTLSADQAVLGRTSDRTFSWRAEGFRASARPWSPRNLTITAPDNGATYSARGNSRNVEINAAALRMEVQLDARNWPNAATAHFDRPVLQILGVRDDIAAASLVSTSPARRTARGPSRLRPSTSRAVTICCNASAAPSIASNRRRHQRRVVAGPGRSATRCLAAQRRHGRSARHPARIRLSCRRHRRDCIARRHVAAARCIDRNVLGSHRIRRSLAGGRNHPPARRGRSQNLNQSTQRAHRIGPAPHSRHRAVRSACRRPAGVRRPDAHPGASRDPQPAIAG